MWKWQLCNILVISTYYTEKNNRHEHRDWTLQKISLTDNLHKKT